MEPSSESAGPRAIDGIPCDDIRCQVHRDQVRLNNNVVAGEDEELRMRMMRGEWESRLFTPHLPGYSVFTPDLLRICFAFQGREGKGLHRTLHTALKRYTMLQKIQIQTKKNICNEVS